MNDATGQASRQFAGDITQVQRDGSPAGTTIVVPVLPLVENVIFPRSLYPLTLRGEQAGSVVQAANSKDGLVALFLQKSISKDNPAVTDLHLVGTLARLVEIEWQEDTINITAEGIQPVKLIAVKQWKPHVTAEVECISGMAEEEPAIEGLAEQVITLYGALLDRNPDAAQKIVPTLTGTNNTEDLVYLVASTLPISPSARQTILEMRTTSAKLIQLLAFLKKAYEVTSQKEVQEGGTQSMPTNPGQPDTDHNTQQAHSLDQAVLDRIELEERFQGLGLSPETRHAIGRELERLSLLSPTSPDYNMIRTYLQALADLPWRSNDESEIDLARASDILNRDHHGLEEIKRRIIEHLAVRKLRLRRASPSEGGDDANDSGSMHTQPILCLVGPPGVGKTSLGRSIAEALTRPFVRISLGGVSDEAEIRGHRRTYLGAMPGRIVQSLIRVGSNEPVIMLDELDKIAANAKGDPTAALLDVLDPEQQREFVDHYIDIPFDISCVFFIATANTLEAIPEALRDRLEVIRLTGYTEEEKIQIAMQHMVPKQIEWHALDAGDLEWEEAGVVEIIRSYTREAGVRQLEREIATICRRVASTIAQEDETQEDETSVQATLRPVCVDKDFVLEVLGTPRFLPSEPEETDQPGVVTGMFWTPVGGDIMHIEAITMPGSKTLTVTGQIGDVMQESAQAALSYIRGNAERLSIAADFFDYTDLHIHIPSGAVSKDGPSAGVALAVALASILMGRPVSGDLAMTGELTLRGKVLPVGGIKEKVLAARRAGIHTVVLPAQNRRDLDSIQPEIIKDLNIIFADTVEEVFDAVFPDK